MRQGGPLLIAVIFVMVGCDYQAPITDEHSIPVDPVVLGLWQRVPEGDETPDPDQRMLILEYTDTEYLVHYPTGDNGMYFRAYPISIEGLSCVQIQLVGTSKGDIKKQDRKYQVVSCEVSKGELEIKILNTELVDKSLGDSLGIKRAFLKHKGNNDLFRHLGKFRKVTEKS